MTGLRPDHGSAKGRANWPDAWPWGPDTPPVRTGRAMVSTTDRYATDVGVDVLRRGGNAVDAAVAVHFALAVVNPEAGNVGGGGFFLYRSHDGQVGALDYRSTAPASATRDMFLDADGCPDEGSVVGHRAAAVPGSVRGMADAHERFGTLAWAELIQPSVELARGFEVRPRYLSSLPPHIVDGLRRFPASEAVFLPGGERPKVGSVLRQTDLAATLERVRDHGADGFYRGRTAELIVAEMDRGGGEISGADLEGYHSQWRDPLRFDYRGHTVLSVPPASSGGVALAEICAILADTDLGGMPWHSAEHVHRMVEAWRRAYADRNHYLADPAFAELPLDALLDPAYGAWRARDVDPQRATPSSAIHPAVEAFRAGKVPGQAGSGTGRGPEGPATTHFSIVDADGNAASVTTTINTWYGSKVVVAGAGILLNNDMDDFTAKPGSPNYFGLVQGEANAIEPGKRMLSAMTPVVVLRPDGGLRLVVGTPGGATITTTVFQVLSNVLDHGMDIAAATVAPRVHHQHLPDRVDWEEGGLPPEVVDELESIGHALKERDEPSGDVQAIEVLSDGTLAGLADPRRGGTAAGF